VLIRAQENMALDAADSEVTRDLSQSNSQVI
jgi:hypothetical protein